MSEKNIKKEDKRKKLIEVAEEVFSRKGYHPVTIADIAQEAGIAKGTFYLYFGSKDEIFQEVVKKAVWSLRYALRDALKEVRDPEEKVRKSIRVSLDHCSRNARLYLLIFHEALFLETPPMSKFKKIYETLISDFRKMIEEGIEFGKFRNVNAVVISHAVVGMMATMAYQWIQLQVGSAAMGSDIDEISSSIAEFCCYGLMFSPEQEMTADANRGEKVLEQMLKKLTYREEEIKQLKNSIKKYIEN